MQLTQEEKNLVINLIEGYLEELKDEIEKVQEQGSVSNRDLEALFDKGQRYYNIQQKLERGE